MVKKHIDEQLQAFFEHNPLDDDLIYLKQFVKEHPENQMGWYLLGKEYEAREKTGKANYCFAQAGEVFEAFEKQKVKLGNLKGVLEAGDRSVLPGGRNRRNALILAGRLMAALLAAAVFSSFWPSSHKDAPAPNNTQASQDAVPSSGNGKLRILYRNPLAPEKREDLWKRLLLPPRTGEGRTLLVEGKLTSDGKWLNALRPPELLMSGSRADSGALQVLYHNEELCNCKPVQDREAERELEDWTMQQEETLILRSAVRAYKELYGEKPPASIDGLLRDFPHNLLPGYTERMKAVYAEWVAAGVIADGVTSPEASTKAQLSPKTEGGPLPYEEPLRIVVDKDTHRLALVSGNAILRSYPVGLGGTRTPEGEFRISVKVKHPNGRDDGDFGSRGMQLSDTQYAIHGTNQPGSIEEDRSLGCVRMLKEDIEELFDMVPSGTNVIIGRGLLPADTIRRENPFRMPALREERNPGKVYRWLD